MSAALRQTFERELKAKLGQRATNFKSEEAILTQAFKYFDLDNDGVCTPPEFVKAMEKIGIAGATRKDLEELFKIYDTNLSGGIDYKEFTDMVYGKPKGTPTKGAPSAVSSARLEECLEKLRTILASRGARGIIGLGRSFRIMDDNNSRTLEWHEYYKAMRDYGLSFTDNDLQAVFQAFDNNRDGSIDYDEFLRTVRGPMSSFRKALVARAFNKFDKDGNGQVDINDIRGVYNAKFHPDVKSGKRTEDEIFNEFLETFEVHHNVLMDKQGDHTVTKEEFEEYYNNISSSIDNDQYFELMMTNAWKLNEAPAYTQNKAWSSAAGGSQGKQLNQAYEESKRQGGGYQNSPARNTGKGQDNSRGGYNAPSYGAGPSSSRTQSVSNQGAISISASAENLTEKLRQKLASRGARGFIGIQRQFKIMDDNNSKTLDFGEFSKAIKDFRVDLIDSEIKTVFNAFDRNRDGSVDYDEFVRYVRGPMNGARIALVEQAFKKLDRSGDGTVDIQDIKGVYNARLHPDVKAGKKTEDEILGDFLETFEMHHNLQAGKASNRQVTLEEFIEYYNNVSASIDNDDYFRLMMTNAWKLGGPDTTQQAWSGQYGSGQKNQSSGRPGTGARQGASQAPFGVSDAPIDYSRPKTGQQRQEVKAAGNQNWPAADTRSQPSDRRQSQPVINSSDQQLMDALRDKLASRGARGFIGLQRVFKIMDDNNSKDLDLYEFKKAMRDFRLSFSEVEVERLFKAFDRNRSGAVDYDEFLRAVRGDMNPARVAITRKAYELLDANKNGVVELDDIRQLYNASQHPDVKLGKRTEDEILAEFLDTFEMHYGLSHEGARDGRVNMDEFIEYYANISMSIDDDQYYELMIKRAWNMDGSKTAKQAWKSDYY